jgi:hypothetical protein
VRFSINSSSLAFVRRPYHKKVATSALERAGVDEVQRFWALARLVKIDTSVVKNLERGRK